MRSIFNDMRKQLNKEPQELIHLQGQVQTLQG